MFIDANYVINRQKTTEKSKNFRKVFKIYDKGFEMAERLYGAKAAEVIETAKILRVETIMKRCNEPAIKFFTTKEILFRAQDLYNDFSRLIFFRKIVVDINRRKSEIDRARECYKKGCEEVIKEKMQLYRNKEITSGEYRSWLRFVENFQNNSKKTFSEIKSTKELEYHNILLETYKRCKI
jgi:hypothetical protein